MKTKMRVLALILTWCFLLAVVRLLIIMSDETYTQVGTSQSYATVEVARSRGTIYDCNGKSMTNATQYYRAAVVPSAEAVARLSELLTKTGLEELMAVLRTGKPAVVSCPGYFEAPGAYVHRYYSYYSGANVLSPHLLGYLNSDGDGVCGIERAFDSLLKAQGALKVSFCLDARGRALSGVEPIVSGEEFYHITQGVVTTLDTRIQRIVEEEAQKQLAKGSVVVMDAGSGEIRAAASYPSYCVTDVAASLKADDSPLLNRTLCAYNVGSVFKLCVAAAALEQGISAQQTFSCKGSISVGKTVYHCNNKTGHGVLDMRQALCKSCNCYFIQLAQSIGGEAVLSMAEAMRFGNALSLCDGVTAAAGSLPTAEELQTSEGALANFSFGQGRLLATPVQIAAMTACIASGGLYTTPTLIRATVDEHGEQTPYAVRKTTRIMKESNAKLLQSMMASVITEGTGSRAAAEGVLAGGKTATAETGWYVQSRAINQAWFTGYAGSACPQYVITVLAEDGSSGAVSAAPLFSAIAARMKQEGIL